MLKSGGKATPVIANERIYDYIYDHTHYRTYDYTYEQDHHLYSRKFKHLNSRHAGLRLGAKDLRRRLAILLSSQ